MTTTWILLILLIGGSAFIGWIVLSIRRQKRWQSKIDQRRAMNRREAEDRKAHGEEGRELRKNIQEWEKEFLMLDATQFFNPRQGGRVKNLNLKKHDYRAKIEQYTDQAGVIRRELVVSDLTLVEMRSNCRLA